MTDPLTIPAFTAWVKEQDASKEYEYVCPTTCPIAQFLHAHGLPHSAVGPYDYTPNIYEPDENDFVSFDNRLGKAVQKYPRTFGALLARLEALR